jgi:4-aminobutyrate aminotransferase/(S)-3-amino-2-methylpropionate transaminase
VACAAALGAIATIEEENLVQAAVHIGEIMLPFLRDLQGRYPVIGDVRGRGAMTAVELVKPGTKEPAPDATSKVAAFCAAEGVLVLTAGTYGNVLRFLPPLVISEDLLRDALGVIEKAFASLT